MPYYLEDRIDPTPSDPWSSVPLSSSPVSSAASTGVPAFDSAFSRATEAIAERLRRSMATSETILTVDTLAADQVVICYGNPGHADVMRISNQYWGKVGQAQQRHQQRTAEARARFDSDTRQLASIRAAYAAAPDRAAALPVVLQQLHALTF